MTAIRWNRGFRRLTILASGILLVIGLLWSTVYGLNDKPGWPMYLGAVLVAIAVASIPWLVFVTVRWLPRGFRDDEPTSADQNRAAANPLPPLAPLAVSPGAALAVPTQASAKPTAAQPKTRRSYIWPDVGTLDGAKWATRQAFWAAIFCSAVTVLFVLLSLAGVEWAPVKNFNAWALLDVAVFAAIAFRLHRQSRIAAVAGLALYLFERAVAWSDQGMQNPVMAIVLTLAFVGGVRGAWAHRRLTHAVAHPPEGAPIAP